MVHLLNWANNTSKAKNVEISVRLPESRSVGAFYPADGERTQSSIEDNYVHLRIREFDVHELVVLEY